MTIAAVFAKVHARLELDAMEDKNEETLEFLQNLDARHSHVLDELDALNARIEAVLGTFSQKREGTNGDSVE